MFSDILSALISDMRRLCNPSSIAISHVSPRIASQNDMICCGSRKSRPEDFFAEGIIEQLETEDQMVRVGAMNNIRSAADKVVLREVMFG